MIYFNKLCINISYLSIYILFVHVILCATVATLRRRDAAQVHNVLAERSEQINFVHRLVCNCGDVLLIFEV